MFIKDIPCVTYVKSKKKSGKYYVSQIVFLGYVSQMYVSQMYCPRSKPQGKNQWQILDLGGNTSRGGAVILRKKT